jgi:hypothetical protein
MRGAKFTARRFLAVAFRPLLFVNRGRRRTASSRKEAV